MKRIVGFFRSSVRRRLLVWLGGMTLLMLIVTSVAVAYLVHRFEYTLWQSRLTEEARNSSSAVSEIILRSHKILTAVGSAAMLNALDRQAMFALLLDTEPALLEVVRTDDVGTVLIAAHHDRAVLSSLFTLSQSEWFSQAKHGDVYHSRVQYTFQDDPYLIISQPAEQGGVVAGRLYMEVLHQAIANVDIGQTGRVYIVDAEGEIIAHADRALVTHTIAAIPELTPLFTNATTMWAGGYTNLAGQAVMGAIERIDATGWYVVVEVAQSEAFAPSKYALFVIMSVTIILGIVVMSGNSTFMQRSIFYPLMQLSAGAMRLGQGDLRHRIPNHRQDEIGLMTIAFNEMAEAIERRSVEIIEKNRALSAEIESHRRTQEELRILNASLEERIAQRTHDLELLTAELLRSNKELQEFAFIASHDLQEPLRKIRSFADRLVAHHSDQLDATAKDYLARMESAAARMQALIDALLAYSRVTTKAQPMTPVDLNIIVAEVLSDLEAQIERLHGQVNVTPLATIPADPIQMRQLLQNLIGNALKFHRTATLPIVQVSGDWIAPHTAAQTYNVGFATDAAIYRLCVADNGIGIEPQYFERIFQVFQRLHRRDAYEGTGIGLAICRKIVERHRGVIQVTSTPGAGSCFTVLLPVADLSVEQLQGEEVSA